MNIRIESIPIEPKIRKMDIGKFPVCSKCGSSSSKSKITYCPHDKYIPLRKYIEEVLGEKFDTKKWTMGKETYIT